MKCDLCQPLLSAYSDGVLDGADREAVREHVDACVHCQNELRALQSLKSLLASCNGSSAPSNMVSHIFAAVQSAPSLPSLTCDEALFLLSPYIDNELDETDSRRVLNHVAACDDCHAELCALERQSVILGAMPEMRAPVALKEAILERVSLPQESWLAGLFNRVRTAVTLQPRWSYGFATATVAVLGAVFASHFRPASQPIEKNPSVAAGSKMVAVTPLKRNDEVAPSVTDDAGSTAQLADAGGSKVETVATDVGKGAVTVMQASLSVKNTNGAQPSKANKSSAKIRPPHRNEAIPESLLVSLDKGAVKPNGSQFDIPDDPMPMPDVMPETGNGNTSETIEDVSTLLASAPTVSYHSGGLNVPEESESPAAPAKVVSAPRKIPLGSTMLPLPKGDSVKGRVILKGRRMDGLPRGAVVASFGS